MAEISVIVPVYNVENYIRRCVDSILSQTFTDFELILVDDESTDNSGKICDEYASEDKRVKVIHKKNGGVSSARNAALDIANGEYVAFCDADDYVCSDWLEILLTSILDKNVDSVAINWIAVDDNETCLFFSNHKEKKVEFSDEKSKFDYIITDVLGGKSGWAVWERIFKLNIINQFGIRFCETCGNYAEDLIFVVEYMLLSNSVYNSSYTGYRYFQRDNSMMHKSENVIKLNELNEVSKHIFNFASRYFNKTKLKRIYPVIHYLIMDTEYRKITDDVRYEKLATEIKKINNKKWYKKQCKKIVKCSSILKLYFNNNIVKHICLFSRFCCHNNYKRFEIESGICYKFFN